MAFAFPYSQTDSEDLNQVQQQLKAAFSPVTKSSLFPGVILTQVALKSGSTSVAHTLNRTLQGWFIVRKRSAGDVYDLQDSNPSPDKTLNLFCNSNLVVDIYVF